MTLNDFIKKYNGKYLEVAGSSDAINQCVDSVNAYIRDCLGLPIIEWTNAVDFPSKAGDNYDYILNTPTNMPKEGDIVVWKPSPGHIAVFIEGNVDTFKSFDQNFPLGSPCHIQNHTYVNVIGWLRVKVSSSTTGTVAVDNKVFESLVRKSTIYDKIIVKLNVEDSETVVLGEIDRNIGYEDAVAQKDKLLSEAQAKVSQLESDLAMLQKVHETMRAENAQLTQKTKEQAEMIQKQGEDIANLKSVLQELKDSIQNPVVGLRKVWQGIRELFGKR